LKVFRSYFRRSKNFFYGLNEKMKDIIIAIDGLSGCGKSTLAKQLAEELNYLYIDTGAMYRAITRYFLDHKVDISKSTPADLEEIIKEIHVGFERNENNGENEVTLNGERVEDRIRGIEVAKKVSEVAAIGAVRKLAVEEQKKLAKAGGVVMDGRDIGTVVFPDAELKIYLTASTVVRTDRRYKELSAKNPQISRSEIQQNLEERDYKDMHREISPLRQAADAIVIDNSDLSRAEQLEKVLALAKEMIA